VTREVSENVHGPYQTGIFSVPHSPGTLCDTGLRDIQYVKDVPYDKHITGNVVIQDLTPMGFSDSIVVENQVR
jgi:hypothetical protein